MEEFRLSRKEEEAIQQLLKAAYSVYPERTYFRQLPDFRYLVWEGEELLAQMSVAYRLVNNGGQLLRVFGIADLCVAPEHQHRQLGSQLLERLDALGRESACDFILLMASEPAFYRRHGFEPVSNTCRWLLLHREETLGIAQRSIDQALMVKPLGDKRWREGLVDLMGPMI